MQKKTIWLIVLSALILIIVFWNNKGYLRFYNQIKSEKEFFDFLTQKKELPQTNKEVFLISNRIIYSWNNNEFEKKSTTIVRTKNNADKIISKKEMADLNNNSIQETYSLENGCLLITEESKTVWESPNNWWVDNFDLADSNNDGILDINLSLWKSGSFGLSKPFWIKENDTSVKNHFFILDFIGNAIKLIWGSSNLGVPNCEFKFSDIDGDKKNDLIVIEGDYSQKQRCEGNYVAVWKWNGWGFSNEWRSEKGDFSNLKIEKNDAGNYIIVDSF